MLAVLLLEVKVLPKSSSYKGRKFPCSLCQKGVSRQELGRHVKKCLEFRVKIRVQVSAQRLEEQRKREKYELALANINRAIQEMVGPPEPRGMRSLNLSQKLVCPACRGTGGLESSHGCFYCGA